MAIFALLFKRYSSCSEQSIFFGIILYTS